ncbi:MAG: ECF transporter S component [Oscillospiraceae bacterium]|jgi:uncharacterized membrane protein|nr:ECF transporter S component [Oscillospiraceae bacterium]
MKQSKALKLTLSGVFAALIFVATYFFQFPLPGGSGYVNLGDGFILIAVLLIGPYAIPAAAVGSLISDLLLGYAVYAPATFIIKGLMALLAWLIIRKSEKILPALLAFITAELIMVAGYLVFEGFLYGWPVAIASVTFNLLQGLAGVILGVIAFPAVKRIKKLAKF